MLRLAKAFALAACVAVLAAPAMAQTKWNLPAAYPADNPHSVNLIAFAKDVADATGNKLQITVHPAASLFKAPGIKRAVATGQAQIGEVLISLHENEDPQFGTSSRSWRLAIRRPRNCGSHQKRRSKRSSPRRVSCCFSPCRGDRRASTPRRTSTLWRT
jgi:hypothetical protein